MLGEDVPCVDLLEENSNVLQLFYSSRSFLVRSSVKKL
jgi:hypothetical protein